MAASKPEIHKLITKVNFTDSNLRPKRMGQIKERGRMDFTGIHQEGRIKKGCVQ